jgi:hypothetical protein
VGPDAVTLSGRSRSKRRVSVGLGCLGQRNGIGGGYGRDFGLRALSMERLLQDEFCWVGIMDGGKSGFIVLLWREAFDISLYCI